MGNGSFWLGIDLGTQGVRAVVISRSGLVVGRGSHFLASYRDGPCHEQDPENWWQATATACRAALAGVPVSSIQSLAVDGTSGSILLVDQSCKPLTRGLMYDDSRALNESRIANEVGASTWSSLGYRTQPSWALPKLLWLLRENPGLARSGRLAHQADFINCRLAGHEVASDSSNSLKSGYDLIREAWPHEVLDALGSSRSRKLELSTWHYFGGQGSCDRFDSGSRRCCLFSLLAGRQLVARRSVQRGCWNSRAALCWT